VNQVCHGTATTNLRRWRPALNNLDCQRQLLLRHPPFDILICLYTYRHLLPCSMNRPSLNRNKGSSASI